MNQNIKMISWNVNGLRACMQKGFLDFFESEEFDIFCVQEIKMLEEQNTYPFDGYFKYWNPAVKKGYSGTAVFAKTEPLSVSRGMGWKIGTDEHDAEGRIITLEFEKFYLVNVYTPNSKHKLLRLPYRMEWEDVFRGYVCSLDELKPVIICGDLNVAHTEMDIKNAKSNVKNPGFTPDERQKMTALLDAGFTDSFRFLNPDKTDAYTWWSYMSNSRARNIGWRIDYFIVSDKLRENITDAMIYDQIFGSDHCPVGLVIK